MDTLLDLIRSRVKVLMQHHETDRSASDLLKSKNFYHDAVRASVREEEAALYMLGSQEQGKLFLYSASVSK